jgi:hypothetical protein
MVDMLSLRFEGMMWQRLDLGVMQSQTSQTQASKRHKVELVVAQVQLMVMTIRFIEGKRPQILQGLMCLEEETTVTEDKLLGRQVSHPEWRERATRLEGKPHILLQGLRHVVKRNSSSQLL